MRNTHSFLPPLCIHSVLDRPLSNFFFLFSFFFFSSIQFLGYDMFINFARINVVFLFTLFFRQFLVVVHALDIDFPMLQLLVSVWMD